MENANNNQGGNERKKLENEGKVLKGALAATVLAVGAVILKHTRKAGKPLLQIGKFVISRKEK